MSYVAFTVPSTVLPSAKCGAASCRYPSEHNALTVKSFLVMQQCMNAYIPTPTKCWAQRASALHSSHQCVCEQFDI